MILVNELICTFGNRNNLIQKSSSSDMEIVQDNCSLVSCLNFTEIFLERSGYLSRQLLISILFKLYRNLLGAIWISIKSIVK